MIYLFFFFNDTATTEIYTLSLHDALPILRPEKAQSNRRSRSARTARVSEIQSREKGLYFRNRLKRSEEHTSELQSRPHLVCRLLLEKKKHYQRSSNPTSSLGNIGS